MRSQTVRLASILIVALTAAVPSGQSKAPVPLQDYGKFETLPPQPRAGLSPDGKWLAYGINRSNRDNELRVVAVASGTPKVVAFGSQATFSADSQWLAYAIGQSEAQEEKLRQQKKPIQRKLGTLRLASGDMTTVEGIETFAFNASGTHLAMKRYAPERKDQPEQPAADDAPAGTTLIVRELATGRDTTFGNVTEFVWQDKGKLLALTISADDKTGNGVQLFDPESGSLRVLDSAAAIYTGLTWRKEADDLAVLRGATDDHHDGATHAILAWRKLGTIAVVRSPQNRRRPGRIAHRLVSASLVVRRWPHDLRRHRALDREGSRPGEAEGRRQRRQTWREARRQGRGEGA